jgi:hypothetical protein
MSDLGEMLNVNIKELNELGQLGIVFGGKATKNHYIFGIVTNTNKIMGLSRKF